MYVVDTRKRRSPSATAGDGDRGDNSARRGGEGARGGGASAPRAPGRTGRNGVRKGRVALLVAAALVIAWIIFLIWVPVAAWRAVPRVDNVPDGPRPADTHGYNYLLVGSDSREGLTKKQIKEYATGNAEGTRTDTIMLVHVPGSGGKPVLVSIPRDSYVPISGHGSNKINAAFSLGGPKLLTETVEQATGIRLDGYVEIGFGGFASMVDSVGGVRICVPRDMKDKKAGIDLKKGCQILNGGDALGYVRSRYEDPLGDIGRANRQREFLGALLKQAANPATVLLPWRYKSFADAASRGLAVGEDTSFRDAIRVLQAMRAVSNDQGLSLSVPTSDLAYQTGNAGLAVKWDTERANALFRALKDDEPLTTAPPGSSPTEPSGAGP
ncbi:MAG: LCP family protein [Micrococcales bacterium]|nr:LCP family protein [Micrococcales bacterium]